MYSKEHINYIKKKKKNNLLVLITQILIIVVFLITWELLAKYEIINSFITSSPSKVLYTLNSIKSTLLSHIATTLYETVISFLLGTLLGLIIATILWWSKFLAKIIDPYLTILNSLPKVALGPIIIIWAGAKPSSIIIMSLFISLIVAIMNIYHAFIETDNDKIKLLKSFKASKFQIFTKLVLPYNIPSLINTLKINVSMSLIGVIMGEFLVSKKGIGYLIMYGSQVFNLNLVITGIIILCVFATLLYYFISLLEKVLRIKN